jgi:endogenous inhibitor of DNA gyrase (YacG/DUF329 family)
MPAHRNGTMVPCARCGSAFYRKGSQLDRRFCAIACWYASRTDQRIRRICPQCHAEHFRPASDDTPYCSTGCSNRARKPRPAVPRFWRYVDKNGPIPAQRPDLGPCWVWTGSTAGGGYGQFSVGGRTAHRFIPAHRYCWELHNGPIPAGLWGLHKCDNPPCVRPEHLFIGTCKDNVDDMIRKGRQRNKGTRKKSHANTQLAESINPSAASADRA